MVTTSNAFFSFSADDLEKVSEFYQKVLGLPVREADMGMLEIQVKGNKPFIIYPKENHVPATFTVLNFHVLDIDKAVEELNAHGVDMEKYEDMGTDDKGILRGVERGEGPNIAWFKDPAGNILSIIEDEEETL